MTEHYGQLAGGNRPRETMSLLISCPRPNTSGIWPQFTARQPPHISRFSIGTNQPHTALLFLSGSFGPVTIKAEIGLHRSPSK